MRENNQRKAAVIAHIERVRAGRCFGNHQIDAAAARAHNMYKSSQYKRNPSDCIMCELIIIAKASSAHSFSKDFAILSCARAAARAFMHRELQSEKQFGEEKKTGSAGFASSSSFISPLFIYNFISQRRKSRLCKVSARVQSAYMSIEFIL
jgi:hypothetical protein